MSTSETRRAIFLRAVGHYLLWSAALHGAWEFAQLPLYTVWTTATRAELIFDVLHCTTGDCLIAVSALLISIFAMRARDWPKQRYLAVSIVTIGLGVVYAAYSEWHNVYVRGAWAYADRMPTLHIQGYAIGASPLLQWLLVPPTIFWFLRKLSSAMR